jgi:hypothetical protein
MITPILRRVRVRWWILIFMLTFALMSFVQRTRVAVPADTFMPILHLSQVRLGLLNTAFFATYTAMQIPGGALGQIFGVRRTYVLVGVLSLAATLALPLLSMALTGTALFVSLLIAQLVLGVALARSFRCSPRLNGHYLGGAQGLARRGREGAASRARPRSLQLHYEHITHANGELVRLGIGRAVGNLVLIEDDDICRGPGLQHAPVAEVHACRRQSAEFADCFLEQRKGLANVDRSGSGSNIRCLW